MISCERDRDPQIILEQILRELDDSEVCRLIDDPLEAALTDYLQQLDLPANVTQEDVLAAAAGLVMHLYAHALPFRRLLPERLARAEAAHLLERSYSGAAGAGFSAGLFDASEQGPEGVQSVLMTLAGAVKTLERREMLWTSLDARLALLSLAQRYRLAEHVWEKWGPYHEKVRVQTPGEVMLSLSDLISEFADSENDLRRLFAR